METALKGLRTCATAALLATAGCADAPEPPAHLRIAGAAPERGRALVLAFGCGACHRIEGVPGARGMTGPPLVDFAERALVAGIFPNTPQNLVAWIIDPPARDPRTGMPAMGVSEAEARDIASYLYSLGADTAQVYPEGPPLPLRGRKEPAKQG